MTHMTQEQASVRICHILKDAAKKIGALAEHFADDTVSVVVAQLEGVAEDWLDLTIDGVALDDGLDDDGA